MSIQFEATTQSGHIVIFLFEIQAQDQSAKRLCCNLKSHDHLITCSCDSSFCQNCWWLLYGLDFAEQTYRHGLIWNTKYSRKLGLWSPNEVYRYPDVSRNFLKNLPTPAWNFSTQKPKDCSCVCTQGIVNSFLPKPWP
jgi:hypothetical protein